MRGIDAGHCNCKGNSQGDNSTGRIEGDSDDTHRADEKPAMNRNRNGAAAAGEAIGVAKGGSTANRRRQKLRTQKTDGPQGICTVIRPQKVAASPTNYLIRTTANSLEEQSLSRALELVQALELGVGGGDEVTVSLSFIGSVYLGEKKSKRVLSGTSRYSSAKLDLLVIRVLLTV